MPRHFAGCQLAAKRPRVTGRLTLTSDFTGGQRGDRTRDRLIQSRSSRIRDPPSSHHRYHISTGCAAKTRSCQPALRASVVANGLLEAWGRRHEVGALPRLRSMPSRSSSSRAAILSTNPTNHEFEAFSSVGPCRRRRRHHDCSDSGACR